MELEMKILALLAIAATAVLAMRMIVPTDASATAATSLEEKSTGQSWAEMCLAAAGYFGAMLGICVGFCIFFSGLEESDRDMVIAGILFMAFSLVGGIVCNYILYKYF